MNHVLLRASRRPLFFREKIFMGNRDVYELFRASSLFIIVLCRVFCLPACAHTLALVARGSDLARLKYRVRLYGGVKTMIGRARARTRVIALNCASLDKFYVPWSRERFAMGTPAARSLYKVASVRGNTIAERVALAAPPRPCLPSKRAFTAVPPHLSHPGSYPGGTIRPAERNKCSRSKTSTEKRERYRSLCSLGQACVPTLRGM